MEKNKNGSWVISAALVIGFVFVTAGCSSTIAAVKDIPPESLCQLDLTTNYITVTSFDGDSVRWKKGIGGLLTETLVDLPAGTHSLEGNYDDGSIYANGMSITHTFEANHVYALMIRFESGGFFSSGTARFEITDTTALYGRQIKRK
jgi:hypothetical protein